MTPKKVLVTGSSGYLGSQTVAALALRPDLSVIALDVREPAARIDGVAYEVADIRAPEVDAIVARHTPDVIVHLASIVTPGKNSNRAFEYDVDVNGTRNLLQACVKHGVRRIIVSSSGAAYGYHADNPEWLTESDPVRGNEAFAYSCHKRLVEEMLADYRQKHPELEQVIFRIGTILGPTVRNQITDPVREAEDPRHRRLGQPVCLHPRPGRCGRHPARYRFAARPASSTWPAMAS
jgi:UDP-glucose 4-epimerase